MVHFVVNPTNSNSGNYTTQGDAAGGTVAMEVKLARTVSDRDVRHLLWLKDQLGDELRDMVVLHSGATAYRRADGVAVVPLALLGP